MPTLTDAEKSKNHDFVQQALKRAAPEPIPRFRITPNKIAKYGPTPDCVACGVSGYADDVPHTPECQRKFDYALKDDGYKFQVQRRNKDGTGLEEILDEPVLSVFLKGLGEDAECTPGSSSSS